MLLHGIKAWKKGDRLWLPHGIVCCSYHQEGHTRLFRTMGFVLDANPNCIVQSFARDVASYVLHGTRHRSLAHSTATDYGTDWDRLLQHTPKDSHNEVWVDGEAANVIGFYLVGPSPGSNVFSRECQRANLEQYHFEI